MPRPPGPVITHTPSPAAVRQTSRSGIDALAVDPSPALPHGGQRPPEELLDDRGKVAVRRLVHVEGERFVVLVGVADGEPAVQALHTEQLHAVRTGHCVLRFVVPQLIQRGARECGVVAEAVAVGDGRRQLLVERLRLHHLQAHPTHGQVARDLAGQATVGGAGAHQHDVAVVAALAVVPHHPAVDGPRLGPRHELVPAGGGEVRADGRHGLPGFHRGVARTVQSGKELAS